MYPGYTLAWSYFFNHLMPAINALRDRIDAIRSPEYEPRQDETRLSLNKLLLLLPPSTDFADIQKLTGLDQKIMVIDADNPRNPYHIPLYSFSGQENKYYAIECIKEPVIALRKMKQLDSVHIVTKMTYNDEIKRFYRTLKHEILENEDLDGYTQRGLVVPITVKPGKMETLQNGGLQEIIVDKLKAVGILPNDARVSQTNNREGGETDALLSHHTREEI